MARDVTSIQVRRATQRRLAALRGAARSYDEIINAALDRLPPPRAT